MADDLKSEDVAAQTPDDDALVASLVEEDAAEPAAETPPAPEADAPAEEVPAEETTETPVAEVEEVPAAPVETPAETPSPTPTGDTAKAAQKALQNQSAIERKLDALLEKIGKQGEATPQQVQQVQALQTKAAEVADEVLGLIADGYEIDPFSDTKKVVKKVVGQDARIAALETRVQQAEARTQQAEETARWATVEAKYPGVDVRVQWSKAREQAKAEGFDADLEKRANYIFHETAQALAAPKPKPATPAIVPSPKAPEKPAPTTARKVPPTTPGGASVTVGKSGAVKRPVPVSSESFMDKLADQLVE